MPKLPSDQEIVSEFGATFPDLQDPFRTLLERTWFRNILYLLGEQWLDWHRTNGAFAARYNLNYGVSNPVSNITRDHVKAMMALFLNKNYKARVWPNSNEQKDKDAAQLATDLIPWLDAETDGEIEDTKEMTALWTVLVGSGFTRTYAGAQFGRVINLDKDGNEIKQSEVQVDSLIPFNFVEPSLGVLLKHKKWIGLKSLVYREWAEDNYGIEIQKTDTSTLQVDYQKQLLTLVASVSAWLGQSGLQQRMANQKANDLVVIQEKEYAPTKDFPDGRYAAVINGQVVRNQDHLPLPVQDRKWSYTVDHFIYNRTPGGFWPTGSVDDLISPQNTINEIDLALKKNRKGLGRPIVLTPTDLTLRRLSKRSSDILAVSYEGSKTLGLRPQLLSGVPYPNQILEERALQKEVAQEAAGDPKHVLRGKAPYAGAPGIAIDILRETAEQSHGPDIARYYRTWQRVERKRLIIVGKTYTNSRILKVPGKGNAVLVRQFKGSDLMGNTDVRLELDSGLSYTNAGKNQVIMQMLQYGMWDPMRGPKPDVRRELFRRMGLSGFPEEDNMHRARAERENGQIIAGIDLENIATPPMPTGDVDESGQPEVVENYDPVFEADDHYSHVQVHDQLMLSAEFYDMSQESQSLLVIHRQYHAAKLAQQMQAEQEVQMAQAQMLKGTGTGGQGPTPVGLEETGGQ